jgi:hypothetical protein
MTEHVTCSRCGARWTGLAAAHCGSCCQTFGVASLFDAHRRARGDRGGCSNPAELVDGRGDRIMFYRDGCWRGPEAPAEVKASWQRLAAQRKRERSRNG